MIMFFFNKDPEFESNLRRFVYYNNVWIQGSTVEENVMLICNI